MSAFTMVRRAAADADERGAAMAEYGLLLAGIAAVVGGAAALFGGRVLAMFAAFNLPF